jgi:hypothetical protein
MPQKIAKTNSKSKAVNKGATGGNNKGGRWVTSNGRHMFIQDKGVQGKAMGLKRRSGENGKLALSDKNNKLRNGNNGNARISTTGTKQKRDGSNATKRKKK